MASPIASANPDRAVVPAFTTLVLDVFRLNGALLAAGDALVADLGLTSARWQVLGAIAQAAVPLPVAHLGRNMGLTRQAVQRTVDELRVDGFVCLEPNPHHRRAPLVVMTERGETAMATVTERQERWAAALATDLQAADLVAAAALLRTLQTRLAANPTQKETHHAATAGR